MYNLTPEDVDSIASIVEHNQGEIVGIPHRHNTMPTPEIIEDARRKIQIALEKNIQESIVVNYLDCEDDIMKFYCFMKHLPKREPNESAARIPRIGTDINEVQLNEICERLADDLSTTVSIRREDDVNEQCFFEGIMGEIQRYTESEFNTPILIKLIDTEEEQTKRIYIRFKGHDEHSDEIDQETYE